MAPTFPLALPSIGYEACEFTLARQVVGARLRSGAAQRIGRGVDYWRASYRTIRLDRDGYDDLMAFIETLSFGLHGFLAYDVGRQYPRTYPNGFDGLLRPDGTTAFDGTADLSAITSETISIADLPPDFVFRAGDWLGLVQSGSYGLHRFQEDRTASGTGTLADVYLSPPPLSTVFTTGTGKVNLARPKALMLLDPEPVSAPWTFHPHAEPIVFTAAQKVL